MFVKNLSVKALLCLSESLLVKISKTAPETMNLKIIQHDNKLRFHDIDVESKIIHKMPKQKLLTNRDGNAQTH